MTLKCSAAVCTAVFSSVFLGGCASLSAELQGLDYPADTPILIGDTAYQINTTKCARIRAIDAKGTLDCYDADGRQSAAITPVGEFRRNLVKKDLGREWGSPEHQDVVFRFFHGGGKEKAAQAVMGSVQQTYGAYASTKNLLNTIDRSKAIDARSAQIKADGAAAYMAGGMPAWQAYRANVVQWHLENSRFFSNQMNALTPLEIQ